MLPPVDMPDQDANRIATRECWKVLPLPEIRVELGFAAAYTSAEFELIKRGLIPEEMEDKWFVFFEEPWLYFHRSWTGAGIYGVEFQSSPPGVSVVASWVSGDINQDVETGTDYDRAVLTFLIDAFLLRRPAKFPVPEDLPAAVPKGVYQHHMAGNAYTEAMFPADRAPAHSGWLVRFVKWIFCSLLSHLAM